MLVSVIFSTERITFVSASPFSFQDIITNLDNQESQEVFGILKFPDNYSKEKNIPLLLVLQVV